MLAIESNNISDTTKLEVGGILALIVGRNAMYEINKAPIFMIFLPDLKLSWKNIPKLINPKIIIGKNKLKNGTKGLRYTGYTIYSKDTSRPYYRRTYSDVCYLYILDMRYFSDIQYILRMYG